MLKPGTKVRMSEQFKEDLGGECRKACKHLGPFAPEEAGGECDRCCWEHIKEFEDCIGIVIGHIDHGDNCIGCEVWPEIDVRWQPSNLKYAYKPEHLIVVED